MDSKKFVNLNSTYKDFLNQIEPLLKDVELTKNIPMKRLQEIHDSISGFLGGGYIERNDLNNMLINCTNSNSTLAKLKDFVYLRNLKILEKTIKHDKYKAFVEGIRSLKEGVSYKSIDNAFFKILKPYLEYWDGTWRFIDYSKGKVRGVEVLDPSDIQKFNSYLD